MAHVGAWARRAVYASLAVVLVVLAGALVAGHVLTRPARSAVGAAPDDLVARRVDLRGASGGPLYGWLVPGMQGGGAVVLMHGLRANRLAMVDRARFLSQAGFTVLLFDFGAHGESAGDRITFGARESVEARAAVDFVRAQAPGERVGAVGVSLGGAAALLGREPLPVDALVLESVYPTVGDAVANRLRMRLGTLGPPIARLLTLQLRPRVGVSADKLRPIDRLDSLRVPVLLLAGTADRHTTLAESRRMFERLTGTRELWAVDGARHVDLYSASPAEYERRVGGFLERHLRRW